MKKLLLSLITLFSLLAINKVHTCEELRDYFLEKIEGTAKDLDSQYKNPKINKLRSISDEDKQKLMESIKTGEPFTPTASDENSTRKDFIFDYGHGTFGNIITDIIIHGRKKYHKKWNQKQASEDNIWTQIIFPSSQQKMYGNSIVEEKSIRKKAECIIDDICPRRKFPMWIEIFIEPKHPWITGQPPVYEMNQECKDKHPDLVVYPSTSAIHIDSEKLEGMNDLILEEHFRAAANDWKSWGPTKRMVIPKTALFLSGYAGGKTLAYLKGKKYSNKKIGTIIIGGAAAYEGLKKHSDAFEPFAEALENTARDLILGMVPGTAHIRQTNYGLQKCLTKGLPEDKALKLSQYYNKRENSKPAVPYPHKYDHSNLPWIPNVYQSKGPTTQEGLPTDFEKSQMYAEHAQKLRNKRYVPHWKKASVYPQLLSLEN